RAFLSRRRRRSPCLPSAVSSVHETARQHTLGPSCPPVALAPETTIPESSAQTFALRRTGWAPPLETSADCSGVDLCARHTERWCRPYRRAPADEWRQRALPPSWLRQRPSN